jgi:hypothetical protein
MEFINQAWHETSRRWLCRKEMLTEVEFGKEPRKDMAYLHYSYGKAWLRKTSSGQVGRRAGGLVIIVDYVAHNLHVQWNPL